MAVNKTLAIISVIVVALLLFFGVRWLTQPKPVTYSDNPADWLGKAPAQGVSVNMREATRGKGDYNGVNEQFVLPGGETTAFAYEGVYKGNFFETAYIDEKGKPVMLAAPELHPGDGVLEGFMVERVNNGVLETHIFLDEDWRRALGNDIRIVWGADYTRSKPFAFEQVAPGIYHDAVQDDASRISPTGSTGGVQVGNMQPGGVDPSKADNIIMMAIH